MKGLIVEKNGEVQIVNDIPEPKIGPYDALVETIACGICNSTDLKSFKCALDGCIFVICRYGDGHAERH